MGDSDKSRAPHIVNTVFIAPVFVSHLHNMYDQFVKIYTDGSKTLTKAGCGIYVADKNLKYSIAIDQFSNSFTFRTFCHSSSVILHLLVENSQCCHCYGQPQLTVIHHK